MGHFYGDRNSISSSSIIFRGDSDVRTNPGPGGQVPTLMTFADLQLRMWVRQGQKSAKCSCGHVCRNADLNLTWVSA